MRQERITVFQVIKDDVVVGEFGDLPSARAKAVEVNARVRVEMKLVEIKP